jgi:hypothetical protein
MNLEETIAITQNFVNGENLPSVLNFLATKKSQISGFQCDDDIDIYELLVSKLDGEWSDVIEKEKLSRTIIHRHGEKRKFEDEIGSSFMFSFV